jgi:zinc protease
MAEAAESVIQPQRLVWVVVGDRVEVEEGIRELNLGEVHLIDSEGNPVE